MKRSLLLLLCSLALSVHALGNADVALTSFTANKTTVQSGEDVTLTIRLKNLGADAAIDTNLNLLNTYGEPLHVLSSSASAGWVCSSVYPNCWATSFAAGAETEVTLTVLTPPTVRPSTFSIEAFTSSGNESEISNNRLALTIALQASTRVADLSLSLSAPPNPVAEQAPVTLAYDVRNGGPQDLNDVRVAVYVSSTQLPLTFAGNGWTCAQDTTVSTCRRASLAAGTNAPLEVRLTTSAASELVTHAGVFAVQPHLDPNLSNEQVWRTFSVGDAANWRRILLPLTATDVAGANGSLWKSELSAVIESPGITTVPDGCGGLEDPCARPPVNKLFDIRNEFYADEFGSQFLYVAREDAAKLKVATRVYDASKSGETAGAFIPSARDDDFSAEGFSLIAIPVGTEFRSTLRIYEYNATDGGVVDIALFGDDADQPFYRGSLQLASWPLETLTTALLPSHPAMVQVDLSSLIPAGRYSRVRVQARPQEDGMKLWGFVSITNNTTSHVTVVTP